MQGGLVQVCWGKPLHLAARDQASTGQNDTKMGTRRPARQIARLRLVTPWQAENASARLCPVPIAGLIERGI
jgi:hypothetical protein